MAAFWLCYHVGMPKTQKTTAGGRSSGGKEINVKNRTLFEGDNLDFLQGIDTGTVHLIATDPPFNKNKDFHAEPGKLKGRTVGFKDRWRWMEDVHVEWKESIQESWPETWLLIETAKKVWGYDMAAFLCWLGVRLMEMHRVLRDDGSIYLHIDHTAHAYVKVLMDSIFGRGNFRNEIVWCYTGPGNFKRYFPPKHDTILFYTKGKNWTFNIEDVRIPYVKTNTGKTAGIFKEEATMNPNGKIPEDYWLERRDSMTPVARLKNERTCYPTQKPVSLYERIILASSNEDDVVLDPFCGCATTLVAAERNKRRWVGMDIWEGAEDMVLKRLEQEHLSAPSAQKQIKGRMDLDLPEIYCEKKPPKREDKGENAAEGFYAPTKFPLDDWQKLSYKLMCSILGEAQRLEGCPKDKTVCAGCGRELETKLMHLDHETPRSEHGERFITNRVLLCSKCNSDKSNTRTFRNLRKHNEEDEWMKNEKKAKKAHANAKEIGIQIRDGWGSNETKKLITKHKDMLE